MRKRKGQGPKKQNNRQMTNIGNTGQKKAQGERTSKVFLFFWAGVRRIWAKRAVLEK
jgi:hypothetical protein